MKKQLISLLDHRFAKKSWKQLKALLKFNNNVLLALAKHDYFVFVIISLIVFGISIIMTKFILNSSIKEKLEHEAQADSRYIQNVLGETFESTKQLAIMLGYQIATHGHKDLKYIDFILHNSSVSNNSNTEFYSWSSFDWIDENNKHRVNSKLGVSSNPALVTRSYLQDCKKSPWQLHLAAPDIGRHSGEWIVPAGIGIADKSGKFIGVVSLGFNVKLLNRKIDLAMLKNNGSFIVLDKDFKVVFQSRDNNFNPESLYYKFELENKASSFAVMKNIAIDIVDPEGKMKYMNYYKMQDWPFIILTGKKVSVIDFAFRDALYKNIIQIFSVVSTFLAIIIYIFRTHVSLPLKKLVQNADELGTSNNLIDSQSDLEKVQNLSTHILKLEKVVAEEKIHRSTQKLLEEELYSIKKQLDNTHRIYTESSTAQADFNRILKTAIIEGVESIISCVERTIANSGKSINQDVLHQFLTILDTAHSIVNFNFTTERLKDSDPMKFIRNCFECYTQEAFKKNIHFELKHDQDIPNLLLDELNFKQVICSMLFHSFSLTPPDKSIFLDVTVEFSKSQKPLNLIITIEDTGLGADEASRSAIIDIDPRTHSTRKIVDGKEHTIENIILLVENMHGQFEIYTKPGREGSIFKLTLPYKSFPVQNTTTQSTTNVIMFNKFKDTNYKGLRSRYIRNTSNKV